MHARHAMILGTGKYLPQRRVTAAEMDQMLHVKDGWVLKKSDVHTRYFIKDETASEMGAKAAYAALEAAGLTFADIDCIVCTSGTMEQPIPCTAALIQRAMGQQQSGVPAFDINSTCLSFVAALDVMSYLIDAGRYRRILLVSTEIASIGLNWSHKESAALFGDGAAAVVIGRSGEGSPSRIVHAAMQTFSEGAEMSEIRGGGTKQHPREHRADNADDYLFSMDGSAIFKLAARKLPQFVDEMMKAAGTSMSEIKLVIPHQGSAMAMRLIQKKLAIRDEQMMYITPDHGNTIAASIPMGLHEAIRLQKINRGDRVLLLGTSAGVSLGGVIFDY
ncbi:beta-ketoacyl-ACP synthase III [Paenibacillus sp. GCM10027626]|uniref:beta-ketoacyl-ACP synthase III n=1 Tax=Paenibacillus sp. GCM10027626 TaxID=3273411 RepID=UPI00363503CD